jgi:hypothetical protein
MVEPNWLAVDHTRLQSLQLVFDGFVANLAGAQEFVPKGQQDSAQGFNGFNPGESRRRSRRLKTSAFSDMPLFCFPPRAAPLGFYRIFAAEKPCHQCCWPFQRRSRD